MLFEYTYNDGTHNSGDELIRPDDIFELIFVRDKQRFEQDKVRNHMSHPIHEKIMKELPKNLNIIRAENTKCRTWPTLPSTIHECYLSGNHYLMLPDLSMYNNLIVLELNNNSIESIENCLPPKLARLNLDCNALKKLNKALIPSSCTSISTFSNPYDPYTYNAKIQRTNKTGGLVFNDNENPTDEEPRPKNIYENDHNIHDSGVQKSTKANILYLVDYKKHIPQDKDLWNTINKVYQSMYDVIFSNPNLPGNILKDYAKTPYIMHGVQFVNLVDRIWLRIKDTTDKEIKKELYKRFSEEVKEGNGHCLNGMMVRLVNVFLGFDPNIVVTLNSNQILGARIPAILERLRREMNEEEGKESISYWLKCYKDIVKDLIELEVEYDVHNTWLSPIAEPILDFIFLKYNWNNCSKDQRPPLISLKNDPRKSLKDYLKDENLEGYPWETEYINEKWKKK